MTGRGTYTPDFLRRLTIWGSARLAELAQVLSGVPEWLIGLGLIGVIAGLIFVAWPRGDWEDDEEPAAVRACHGTPAEVKQSS